MNINSIFLHIFDNINTIALLTSHSFIPTAESFSQLFSNIDESILENLYTESNFKIDMDSLLSLPYYSSILLLLIIAFLYYSITPFCVENVQMATLPSLIYAHLVGTLNEKRCNIDTKIGDVSNDLIINYDIPNRLDYNAFMYCEGCPRPLLRGVLHGLVFCIFIPIGWYFLIKRCHATKEKIIFSFYMLCSFFGYLMSYIYHVHSHKYGPIVENFVLKIDRFAIFMNIAANCVPLALLFMNHTGIFLFTLQWFLCFVGAYRIFYLNRSIWWEPLSVGGVTLLFITEIYKIQTTYEFSLTISTYVLAIIASLFTSYKMDLSSCPDIWGYHENFHLFTFLSSLAGFFINYSLAGRYSEVNS